MFTKKNIVENGLFSGLEFRKSRLDHICTFHKYSQTVKEISIYENLKMKKARVTTWHYRSPSLRVVERAEVLPEFMETSDVVKNFVNSFVKC